LKGKFTGMKLLNNEKVIDIISNTLNHVDSRLMDHGKRVAYLLYRVLKPRGDFTGEELRNICILAMLHDVGAYKTEEIDNMLHFETVDIWEHAIYGSLFLKYFSPLKELSDVVLFHHAECSMLSHLKDNKLQMLAQLISICDRADVFASNGGKDERFRVYLEIYRDIKYRKDIVDMYLAADINLDGISGEMLIDVEFKNIFHKTPLSEEEAEEYIDMIIYSIDFRSSHTVIHTLSTVCVAGYLAKKLGLSADDIHKVKTGAILHDIGKVGIPLHILESDGKLSNDEMDIMRTHVKYTEEILSGNVDDDVKFIAINHHEKLNGEGYPKKLKNEEIYFFDRIVAIADIFSALCKARSYKKEFKKDKVIKILVDMAMCDHVDPKVALVAVNNFDEIFETIKREADPMLKTYDKINHEYKKLHKELSRKLP